MMKIWPQIRLGNPPLHMPHIIRSSDSIQYPRSNDDNNISKDEVAYDRNIFNFSYAINPKDNSELLLWPLISSTIGNTIKALCSLESFKHSRKEGPGMTVDYSHITTMGLGKVTGPPTRVHWKPDLFSAHCDLSSDLCTRAFTTFRRRHHCRRCGLIFCHLHSHYFVPLDQDVNFHPHGRRFRVCESCWLQWEKWVEKRSLSPSDSSKIHRGTFTENNAKTAASPIDFNSISSKPFNSNKTTLVTSSTVPENHLEPAHESDQTGQSIPHDWHWSTF